MMSATIPLELIPYSRPWLDELLGMWRESFEAALSIEDPHPLSEQRQYFEHQVVPQHELRLAVNNQRLLGFIAASPTVVSQLYVRVGYQRMGIGSQLLDWAKQQSAGSLSLYTFECNQAARRFYAQHGFVMMERGFESFWQLPDLKFLWKRHEWQSE